MNVQNMVPGESFRIFTPSDSFTVGYPKKAYLRVNSYLDAIAVTPMQDVPWSAPHGEPVGKTVAVHNGRTVRRRRWMRLRWLSGTSGLRGRVSARDAALAVRDEGRRADGADSGTGGDGRDRGSSLRASRMECAGSRTRDGAGTRPRWRRLRRIPGLPPAAPARRPRHSPPHRLTHSPPRRWNAWQRATTRRRPRVRQLLPVRRRPLGNRPADAYLASHPGATMWTEDYIFPCSEFAVRDLMAMDPVTGKEIDCR